MANDAVGEIACRWCGTDAEIRKNTRHKYYVYCPCCGINQPALPAFQEIVINNGLFYGEEAERVQRLAQFQSEKPMQEKLKQSEPETLKQSEPGPELKQSEPEPKQEPERKRKGFNNLAASVAAFMGAEE
jgi:hypothetical protein